MNFFKKSSPVFRPQYRVTDRILNSITRSTAAKELITQVHLPADWVANFRREAIVRSAHASTSLEGNELGFNEVSRLVVDREVEGQLKSKQEVLNYVHALERVDVILKEHRITEARLLRIHYMLTESALDDPAESGAYRLKEISTETLPHRRSAFPAPRAKEVPALVKELLAWLDSFEAEKLNVIIQAGIIHHEIMNIHPFTTGNGLVARFMANVVLYMRNFDTKRLFTLDGYYHANPEAYFAALAPADPKHSDLTSWLEYFSDGVAHSVAEVKERVISLTSEQARGTRPVPLVPPIPE